jgi:hypothetical protein
MRPFLLLTVGLLLAAASISAAPVNTVRLDTILAIILQTYNIF